MEIRLKPETESRLNELASKSGRRIDDLVEDAMAAYLAEVAELGSALDRCYDDLKSGRVKPIDGEAFFERLRRREDDLHQDFERPTPEEMRIRPASRQPVRPRPAPAAAVRDERKIR